MPSVQTELDKLLEQYKKSIKVEDNMDIGGISLSFDSKIYSNFDNNSLKSFINSLDRDILVKISEDLENGETKLDMIPHMGSSCVTPLLFKAILSDSQKKMIENHNNLVKKLLSKNKAKELIKERYKIGDILILRGKIKDGSARNVKEFEVKKVIWSVKSQPINVLILKQLSGTNTNMSLNRNDCKKYHIKYEPGLQVYSMSLNFNKKKKYEKQIPQIAQC